MRRTLPLAVWAGVLSGGAVAAAGATAYLALPHLSAQEALGLGGVAGTVMSAVAVAGAARLAAALRDLQLDPTQRDHERLPYVSLELAELARTLDALHLRVRVADDLGERHRRQAETAGAGVFELLSGLVAAEEGARGQLAAELHDTVAQSLMIARGLLASKPSSPEDIAKLTDYVEDAEEQVRAVMARTRPPALREGDLASAVGGLRADMQARYGLHVHVDWPDSPYPLPLAGAVTVYRFFQEALLNVVKHADVDDAELTLEVTEESVMATVRDAGPGFEPAGIRPDRGRHVGLGLLRERARLSGGGLEVLSSPGAGTTLRLRLPRSARVAPEDVVVDSALPTQRVGSTST